MTARPDEVVAWPTERVNVADPHLPGFRVVGFRIGQDHPWHGEYGLSEPMFALLDSIQKSQNQAAALQSANARLAAVLALADEWYADSKNGIFTGGTGPAYKECLEECAERIRRAAAGEGDANQGDGE